MQGCVAHRGIKIVGGEPSWCRLQIGGLTRSTIKRTIKQTDFLVDKAFLAKLRKNYCFTSLGAGVVPTLPTVLNLCCPRGALLKKAVKLVLARQ